MSLPFRRFCVSNFAIITVNFAIITVSVLASLASPFGNDVDDDENRSEKTKLAMWKYEN